MTFDEAFDLAAKEYGFDSGDECMQYFLSDGKLNVFDFGFKSILDRAATLWQQSNLDRIKELEELVKSMRLNILCHIEAFNGFNDGREMMSETRFKDTKEVIEGKQLADKAKEIIR